MQLSDTLSQNYKIQTLDDLWCTHANTSLPVKIEESVFFVNAFDLWRNSVNKVHKYPKIRYYNLSGTIGLTHV